MLLDILEVLGEGEADALGDAAVVLAVHHEAVVDLPAVAHEGHAVHGGLARFRVHGHLGHEHAVHVNHEGLPLAVFVACGPIHGGPFSRKGCRLSGGNQFVIGHISAALLEEAALRLRGLLEQGLAGHPYGVARHDLGPGTAGRAGIGAFRRVGPREAELVGGDPQGAQRLVGRADGADVRALAVVFPGGTDGDGPVGVHVHPGLGAVGTVEPAAVHAHREADALLVAGRGAFGGSLLREFILRPERFEHLRQGIGLGSLSRGGGASRAVGVLQSDLQGVHAELLRQFVHKDLGGEKGLGRAIGPEG